MSKRLSELYGLTIYTNKGQYVGRVEDIIVNIEKGEVMCLTLKSFKSVREGGEEIRRVLKEESVSYDDVVEVGDIVLVSKVPTPSPKRPSQ